MIDITKHIITLYYHNFSKYQSIHKHPPMQKLNPDSYTNIHFGKQSPNTKIINDCQIAKYKK